MNQQELVEAVLREVKRALAERGMVPQQAPASGSPAPRAQAAPAAAAGRPGGADLTTKLVILLKDLEGRGGGTVHVSRTAVITPMATDYAGEKGISIVRVEQSRKSETVSRAASAPTVGLAVCSDFSAGGGMVRSILESKGFTVREFAGQAYEAAIMSMCNAVASVSVLFGVCLERTGMLGPVHANRNHLIRAVHCRDSFEARAARVDIGANVIVLDAQGGPGGVISGFTGME